MIKNKFINGLAMGIILPLLFFPIVYYVDLALITSESVSITRDDRFIWQGFKTSTLVLMSLCVNLIPTYIANKRYQEEFIRGIMIPTVLYCFVWFFYFRSSIFNS